MTECKSCVHYKACMHLIDTSKEELTVCEHFESKGNIEELKSKNANLISDLSSSKAEIEKLTVELQAMRGAANSYKREVINLELTLRGVMHSVDKWLEGDELKQNEVDRAVTMREKTLQIVERLKNLVEASDKNCKTAVGIIDKWEKQYAFAKAEAVNEFAERLKDRTQFYSRKHYENIIDNLVKEFMEEKTSNENQSH